MDELYYGHGSGCDCCHGFRNSAPRAAFTFSPEVLEKFLRKVYGGRGTDIERGAWREVLRGLNGATAEGLSRSPEPPVHEEEFYRALRHANEVFAAFKVHTMGRQMAAMLTDEDGKLLPFRQWRERVAPVASHHTGAWLRTEYDTAILRAHQAADWRKFERDRDILPNLRWMRTTSPNPEGAHRAFWESGLTLPVEHPFWQEHHPGDRWNCKCSLEQTDEPATPELLDGYEAQPPQRGLENNPGRDGHLFSDSHPYFPESCAKCAFYKPGFRARLRDVFLNKKKDCYNCPYIDGCLDRYKEIHKQKEEIDKKRKHIISEGVVPISSELHNCQNLQTGKLLLNKKPLSRLLNHCRSMEEIDAALCFWRNPNILKYNRKSELGENKDLTDERALKNIQSKLGRGVVAYHEYTFKYRGSTWSVKLEEHKAGFEQPYFIQEK